MLLQNETSRKRKAAPWGQARIDRISSYLPSLIFITLGAGSVAGACQRELINAKKSLLLMNVPNLGHRASSRVNCLV